MALSQEDKEALVSLRDSAAWVSLKKLQILLVENFALQMRSCPEEKLMSMRKRYDGAAALVNAIEENIEGLARQDKQENRSSLKRTRK